MTLDRDLGSVVRAAGITPYYADKQGDFVLIEGDCRDVLPQLFTAGLSPNLIFADSPYHLSNDGGGQMVSVNKSQWDRSAGVHEDHRFVLSWLKPCLSALAQGGSLLSIP
ncbi:MAG: hypothetical protein ACREYE_18070 [Gammaproteobacteria bacterium]